MWFDFLGNPLGNPHLTPKHVLAQFIERAVVVVPHVSMGLAQFLADHNKK